MTRSQSEREEARAIAERETEEDEAAETAKAERLYRRRSFTLTLTPDELDWLLGEVLVDAAPIHAARYNVSDKGNEVLYSLGQWQSQVEAQGYRFAPR